MKFKIFQLLILYPTIGSTKNLHDELGSIKIIDNIDLFIFVFEKANYLKSQGLKPPTWKGKKEEKKTKTSEILSFTWNFWRVISSKELNGSLIECYVVILCLLSN